jgi:hypothetical protein
MGIERLSGRLVKGIHRACTEGDDHNMPDLDDMEERQSRQHEDETGSEALGDDNQTPLITFIGKNSAKEVQTNGWDTVGEPNVSQ